jgi:hypothetical protein
MAEETHSEIPFRVMSLMLMHLYAEQLWIPAQFEIIQIRILAILIHMVHAVFEVIPWIVHGTILLHVLLQKPCVIDLV